MVNNGHAGAKLDVGFSLPSHAFFASYAPHVVSVSTEGHGPSLVNSRFGGPHLLSRSFNRFFLTSLGLLAPLSSHDSTLPTLTVSSSGARTRTLNCVA